MLPFKNLLKIVAFVLKSDAKVRQFFNLAIVHQKYFDVFKGFYTTSATTKVLPPMKIKSLSEAIFFATSNAF